MRGFVLIFVVSGRWVQGRRVGKLEERLFEVLRTHDYNSASFLNHDDDDVVRAILSEEIIAKRRKLYDSTRLAEEADASLVSDDCEECPFDCGQAEEATLYENGITLPQASNDNAVLLLTVAAEPMQIDVTLANACQELNGLELCLGDEACIPENYYIIYDCEFMIDTLMAVARARSIELNSLSQEEIRSRLADASISADDDVWGTLDLATIYIYLLLELSDAFQCSNGCDLSLACTTKCQDTARDRRQNNYRLDFSGPNCTQGTVDLLIPTSQPTAAAIIPTLQPTTAISLPTTLLPTTPSPTTLSPTLVQESTQNKKKNNSSSRTATLLLTIILIIIAVLLCCCIYFICFYCSTKKAAASADEDDQIDHPPDKAHEDMQDLAGPAPPPSLYANADDDLAHDLNAVSLSSSTLVSSKQEYSEINNKIDNADL